jgi:cell division protein FtsW
MLLSMGLVTGIVVQALFNISVVLSLVPTKGIPLPFISYGGSSLVPTLAAVGILLNISQHATGQLNLAQVRSVATGSSKGSTKLRTASPGRVASSRFG